MVLRHSPSCTLQTQEQQKLWWRVLKGQEKGWRNWSWPQQRRDLSYKEENVIPDEVFIGRWDGVGVGAGGISSSSSRSRGRVVRRPILGNEVLEVNAGDLADSHVAVVVHDDLQQPHQMLRRVLDLTTTTTTTTTPISSSSINDNHNHNNTEK